MNNNYLDQIQVDRPAGFMRPAAAVTIALPASNLLGAVLLGSDPYNLVGFGLLVASCVVIAGLATALPETPSSRGLALLASFMNFALAYASGVAILYNLPGYYLSSMTVGIGVGLGLWSLLIGVGGLSVLYQFGQPRGTKQLADANADSVISAASTGATIAILVIASQSVIGANESAIPYLVGSIVSLLIATAVRPGDGFWQLILGMVGGLFGILQIVTVFADHGPDRIVEQVFLAAAICQMYWGHRLVMGAGEVIRRRDAEARGLAGSVHVSEVEA